MNILLLGGAGFIGSNLARQLVAAGYSVYVFDRKSNMEKNLHDFLSDITPIYGDFHNLKEVENIFKVHHIDIIVHLVSTVVPGTELATVMKDMDLNLHSTMWLCELMARHQVKKLVFFSSGGTVYGQNGRTLNTEEDPKCPINYYGWLKLTIEHYIKMAHQLGKLDYLLLRPSNAYGPFQRTQGNQGFIGISLGKIKKHQPIEVWGDGSVVRDFIYIDDLCRAVIQLLDQQIWNETVNVGTGQGHAIQEVLELIQEVTNQKLDITYGEHRRVDIPSNILDITKLQTLIRWQPKVSLQQGIETTWELLP